MILEASDAPCESARFSSKFVSADEPQYAAMTGVPEKNATVATAAEAAIEKDRGRVTVQRPPQSRDPGVLRYLREPPYTGQCPTCRLLPLGNRNRRKPLSVGWGNKSQGSVLMDLTKEYPRSVRDKWQGVVQLGRTVDKGKAKVHGNVGEYHYNCPMDQAVFGFLGIDHEQFERPRATQRLKRSRDHSSMRSRAKRSSGGISSGYPASRKASRRRPSRASANRSPPTEPT
jgi:hypothetical protein